jgi:protein-L-isoaspartate(D-aspartate) O-methyltransferase
MDGWPERRRVMVEQQLRQRGIRDERVLAALAEVPREAFVPQEERDRACDDGPLPIGCSQTISQPYIVAYMSERLELTGGERVLEIGTGSGYQAAVLSRLAAEVFTVEIIAELSRRASATLAGLGCRNVFFREGRGQDGWPEQAPFDRMILTAAPARFPEPLLEQLSEGGVAVAPVGERRQVLVRFRKRGGCIEREETIGVIFVPLV